MKKSVCLPVDEAELMKYERNCLGKNERKIVSNSVQTGYRNVSGRS